MKKQQINESINQIKYLFEYHFKPSGSERDYMSPQPQQEETPVKFSEIGDKYSQFENDYPSYDQYKDEVMIDEDEPVDQKQEVPSPEQQPQPQQEVPPVEPAQQPVQQQPTTPAEPVQPEPLSDGNVELEAKLNDQIAKTDQMLAAINQLQAMVAQNSSQDVNAKLDQVAQEVKDIVNPSYEKQFDMISKQSYPYNIKLSDYWGWNDDKEEEEPKQYTITQSEIDSYDPNLMKQRLGLAESILKKEK